MKLNTLIKASDGRIGTVCYHHLDGYGGVWGKHTFEMPAGGFGAEIPEPEFMLKADPDASIYTDMEYIPWYSIVE